MFLEGDTKLYEFYGLDPRNEVCTTCYGVGGDSKSCCNTYRGKCNNKYIASKQQQ